VKETLPLSPLNVLDDVNVKGSGSPIQTRREDRRRTVTSSATKARILQFILLDLASCFLRVLLDDYE